MPDTFTVHYNFTLPEIGASRDTWGSKLNSNFEDIDTVLNSIENSYIPTAGGKYIVTLDALKIAEGNISFIKENADLGIYWFAGNTSTQKASLLNFYDEEELHLRVDTTPDGRVTYKFRRTSGNIDDLQVLRRTDAETLFAKLDGVNTLSNNLNVNGTITTTSRNLIMDADGNKNIWFRDGNNNNVGVIYWNTANEIIVHLYGTDGNNAYYKFSNVARKDGNVVLRLADGNAVYVRKDTTTKQVIQSDLGLGDNLITNLKDPVNPDHAATKRYVDNNSLTQSAADARYLTQSTADNRYLTQSTADGRYWRQSSLRSNSQNDSRYINKAGDTVTGDLNFGGTASLTNVLVAVAEQVRMGPPSGGPGRFTTYAQGNDKFWFYNGNTINTATVAMIDKGGAGTTDPQSIITREKGDARYASSSSREWKDDLVEDAPPEALWDVPTYYFTYGGTLEEDDPRRNGAGYGPTAEDIEQVFPEGVIYDSDNKPRYLNTGALIGALMHEIVQLRKRVTALETAS